MKTLIFLLAYSSLFSFSSFGLDLNMPQHINFVQAIAKADIKQVKKLAKKYKGARIHSGTAYGLLVKAYYSKKGMPILKFLFKKKIINPNSKDHLGDTIAMHMVFKKDVQGLKVFLKHGGSLKVQSKKMDLFREAIKLEDFKLAELLAKNGVNTRIKNAEGRTPLHEQIALGNLKNVKRFLSWGILPDEQARKLAIGDREILSQVIKRYEQGLPVDNSKHTSSLLRHLGLKKPFSCQGVFKRLFSKP